MKTWRRLQKIGAVPVKNSAYALPNSPQAREDFEWMKTEILAMKGQAAVFTAEHLDEATGKEIVATFRAVRGKEFDVLRSDILKATATARHAGADSIRRRRLEGQARALRGRWTELEAMDLFGAPGREETVGALKQLERILIRREQGARHTSPAGGRLMQEAYRHRVWVTRPRPGIDRLSSAWLIQRFIDPHARFAFADKVSNKSRALPFDMFGVEFGHHGDACTFETLVQRFEIHDSAVEQIAQIVHNLDLKEDKFVAPDAPAIGKLVEGMRKVYARDQELLSEGIRMFEALYLSMPQGKKMKVQSKKGRRSK
ncbi:MAG: chromate resistance protein [Acidobacteria bacterium]|nr:chromate resistance protein [Acidobacteriota bacterium]